MRLGLRIHGLLVLVLAAGCARVDSAPPREPPAIGATESGTVGADAAVQPAPPSTERPIDTGIAKTTSPGDKPSKVPAPPVPADQARKKESVAPGPGKQEAPAPLDLASLEQRLRDTKAIGVFTKISLKNQVDDLLSQFRAFHQGGTGPALPELRERYNLLLLKVLSLVQGSDPGLAQSISASREEIWGLLADPVKFSKLQT